MANETMKVMDRCQWREEVEELGKEGEGGTLPSASTTPPQAEKVIFLMDSEQRGC